MMSTNLPEPTLTVFVHCGACGAELSLTHEQWHTVAFVACACGAGADIAHSRRHVDCPTCEDMGDVR